MNEKKTTKSKTSKKKKNIKEEPTNKLAYKTIDEIRMENQDLQSIISARAYLEQYFK